MGIISLAHKLSHYAMTMWDTYGIDKATPYAKLKKKQETILMWAIHMGSIWGIHGICMTFPCAAHMVHYACTRECTKRYANRSVKQEG